MANNTFNLQAFLFKAKDCDQNLSHREFSFDFDAFAPRLIHQGGGDKNKGELVRTIEYIKV